MKQNDVQYKNIDMLNKYLAKPLPANSDAVLTGPVSTEEIISTILGNLSLDLQITCRNKRRYAMTNLIRP